MQSNLYSSKGVCTRQYGVQHSLSPSYILLIKRVTSIGTIEDLMNANNFSKTFLGEVDRIIRIYLTVPMTSATAERTFSTLWRLKNYLRSTMRQKRPNHVVLGSANDRQRAYFGQI